MSYGIAVRQLRIAWLLILLLVLKIDWTQSAEISERCDHSLQCSDPNAECVFLPGSGILNSKTCRSNLKNTHSSNCTQGWAGSCFEAINFV